MKFGKLLRNYGDYAERLVGFNIGDPMQDYALDLLYQRMGISDDQIVEIRPSDMQTYDGEYVLMPMLGIAISDVGMGAMPFSSHIIPLFLSSHFIKTSFNPEIINYLRNFQPIGCRDEFGLNGLRNHGLLCNLTGCITATFPKRKQDPLIEKVFLVDIPSSLKDKIPAHVLDKAEEITHLLPLSGRTPNNDKNAHYYYKKAIEQIDRYKNEATLVVSSRLHAIAPCVAMGIPVIALTENISERFGWLDRYVKIYTPETFGEINWTPEPIDYEDEKECLAQFFMSEINSAFKKWSDRCDVSWYYESRDKSLYGSRYIHILKNSKCANQKDFDFIIWGCGLIGETTFQVINQYFPKATLLAAIDRYVDGEFHGKQIMRPEALDMIIEKYPEAMIMLTSYSGKEDGYSKMNLLGKEEGINFLYFGTQNG